MKPEFEFDKNLKKYNTFSIAVSAKAFAIFKSEKELTNLLPAAKELNMPLLILGGGSNLLFTKDFEGVILKNEIKGTEILSEDNDTVLVKCGAGESWHEFVLFCVSKGWAGLENLSLIPGTVGASPIQNIGAYGAEVKNTIASVQTIEIESLLKKRFLTEDCAFGYRDSIFKKVVKGKYVITYVVFKLKKHAVINTSYGAIQEVLTEKNITAPTLRDVSNAVIQIRKSKLPNPAVMGNAGSFFKNPEIPEEQFNELKATHPDIPSFAGVKPGMVKVPAGWLIEQSGWKGKVVGHAGVHKMQALVLINYGGATGEDIIQLSLDVRKSVQELFGIELEPEVNII
ncbi:MAG: UDP-N-acetylmuramate dehydrogenase [Bacteroidia bacterium]|nr:UDP-N-acetylmuramate dehydrogenase [Bacteroidia bacterium]